MVTRPSVMSMSASGVAVTPVVPSAVPAELSSVVETESCGTDPLAHSPERVSGPWVASTAGVPPSTLVGPITVRPLTESAVVAESASSALGTFWSVSSLTSSPVTVFSAMSRPCTVLLRMSMPRTSLLRRSRVRTSLFRMSMLRTSLFLISRLSMKPVATPYETPLSETNRATRATIMAGDGRRPRSWASTGRCPVRSHRLRNDFTELLLGGLGCEVSLDQHASGGIGAGSRFRRKGDHEAGAAALRLEDLHLAVVGGRHGADDRQPEAAAAAGRGVAGAAGEPLEHALAHVHGDARAAVRHLEDRPVAVLAPSDRHRYRGARGGVDQRVLDQVAGEPVEVVAHAVQHHRAGHVEGHGVIRGERPGLAGGLGGHRGQVHRATRRVAAGVGARQQQQIAHQAAHAA